MYGAIKTHKPEKNFPMRLIVSTIGIAAYSVSKHLVTIIQPIICQNSTRLKDSLTFLNEAKTWQIHKDEVQVSYDLINLYPLVPIKEATKVILDRLTFFGRKKLKMEGVKKPIDICLQKCYFLWENNIYKLEISDLIGLARPSCIILYYYQII